jgi:DNA polymerase sigma
MKNSDLDICMTLENCSDKEKTALNFKKIIRTLGSLFRREQGEFDMIEERVSAKVPIVKFRHRRSMIEGDISLYNTLALQNTDLLRAYAEIDERTKMLGHAVKYFAKICRIGDASCGSLSSYAYIVMMIHYLMNTTPPVLPCLQNLNRENLPKNETNVTIDGWDCWFNRDIKNLDKLWPQGFKQNKQSVGELWLGFLRYYTETFDWENHVVCIRDNNGYLTRKIKNWTKNMLAIEDPFELTHNLAAGVSPKMGLYILKSFSKARVIFGQVIEDFRPLEIRLNMDYFFNPKSLVEGNPPMDRNCFSCFKIGHQTKDCPLANKRRDKQQPNNDNYKDESCFRCKNFGHMARDCPMTNEQINNNGNNKRNRNSNNNNINAIIKNDSPIRCFKCNQTGHYARDCPDTNKNQNNGFQNIQMLQQQQQRPTINPTNHQFQQIQHQQLQFQQQLQGLKINQQSAPAPKIITFMNPPLNPPIVLKTGDNVQFLVNPNLNSGTNFPSSSSTSSSASSPSSANNEAVLRSSKNQLLSNTTNQSKQKKYQILVQQQQQQQQPSPTKGSNNNIVSCLF